METKRLDKYRKFLVQCTQCGYCKEVCPVFGDVGWDSSVARGKIALASGLYNGDIEPDDSIVERLYQCTTCGDCFRRCPSSTEVVEVVEALRMDLNEAGYVPEIFKKISGSVKKYGNPFGEKTPAHVAEDKPRTGRKRVADGVSRGIRDDLAT